MSDTFGTQSGGGGPLPALPGEVSPLGVSAAPAKRSKIQSQFVVFGLVLCVSGVALFTMRKMGVQAGIKMAEASISLGAKDSKEDAVKAETYERIMADLQRVQRPLDVALTEFGKSPFMLPSPAPAADPVAPKVDLAAMAAEAAKRELEAQRQKLAQAFSALKLQSTMKGRVPLARINGDTYRAGDVVGDDFKIREIRDREVVLVAGDDVFVLSMDPDDQPPKGKHK